MTIASEPPAAVTGGAAYPRRGYAWTVVAILIATAILSYTDRQVLSLLVDPIRHDLKISDTQISLLLGAAFAVVYGVAGLPLGFFADRTSRRNLIFGGVVVWSLATIACGLSRDFNAIFASRLFVGLGEAVLSPAAISLISDYFPPQRRGFAVGLFLSGIAMGSGVAILIGGGVLRAVDLGVLAGTPLAAEAPWRLVLLLIGLPGLIWSLIILAIREPARQADAASQSADAAAPVNRFAAWAKAAPVYAVVATASLVDNAVGAWSPSLLIREFAKDPGKIGIELGLLLTIGFGGGVLIGGLLADRAGSFGRKLAVCLTSAGLILPAALLMNSGQFVVVLVSVPLYFADPRHSPRALARAGHVDQLLPPRRRRRWPWTHRCRPGQRPHLWPPRGPGTGDIGHCDQRLSVRGHRFGGYPAHGQSKDALPMMNTIFVLIKCELGTANDVAADIVDNVPNVSEVYSTSGQYDLIAKFNLDEVKDVGSFITRTVQVRDNIRETFTIMTFSPFLPKQDG